MRKSKIFSIVNQKGGVGKTTTAVNLAASLAFLGKKILLIDLDAQANSSSGIGIKHNERFLTLYQVLKNFNSIEDVVIKTAFPNLNFIPSNLKISSIDIEISNLSQRERILSCSISKIRSQYDYIFIDCPPSLSLLTMNALVSSDEVIIPMICDFYSLEGLSSLIYSIKNIEDNFNSNIKIAGILFTMYDKRNRLTEQVEHEVRSYLGDLVYKTNIPRNIKLAEAPSYGKPVLFYDKKCLGALAYMDLAQEIMQY
ncbi:MAG: ParA family protein [Rickettsia sp.]|nr:ParA family protein [Rickettsia sp.]